jgi:hypothetical protein
VSDLAGQLDIRLHTGEPPGVQIVSSRPLTAARVFAGKPIATVAGQLPLLFSVCGTAQALACAHACEAALGVAPAPTARLARGLLLCAETAKEHLWRLLLDWPKAVGQLIATEPSAAVQADLEVGAPGREAAMAAALRAFLKLRAVVTASGDPFLPGAGSTRPVVDGVESARATLAATAAEQVFGGPPADWLATTTTAADLHRWAEGAPTVAAALVRTIAGAGLAALGRSETGTLPAGDGAAVTLLERLAPALAGADADDFVAAPVLDGHPVETTPFAREHARGGLVADLAGAHGNGLLPRLAALLVELARHAALLEAPGNTAADTPVGAWLAPAAGPDARVGLGAAPAARGLLVHRVELAGGDAPETARVWHYRILAPTEWNFHPAGVVAAGLAADRGTVPFSEARARLLVTAVDPCVDYRLSVS